MSDSLEACISFDCCNMRRQKKRFRRVYSVKGLRRKIKGRRRLLSAAFLLRHQRQQYIDSLPY